MEDEWPVRDADGRLVAELDLAVVELWWSDLDRMTDVLVDLGPALDRAAGKP